MPAASKTEASPKASKPITRSSLRQTLNLASVGKAFAEAISSKDAKDTSKNAKKVKESRRSSVASVASLQPAAPAALSRASMDVGRPSSQVSSKRTSTPDSKPISTRKRGAAASQRSASEDQTPTAAGASKSAALDPAPAATSPQPLVLSAKGPSLRPRTANATSALPKYRPKSAAVAESAKPPSPSSASASISAPVRAGTRRRLSTSDDEKKEQTRPTGAESPSPDKMSRPISPLPQRAALRANLTNVSPPTTPSKTGTPPPARNTSPSRPAKVVKTAAGTSSMVPRAASSSSVSLQPKASTPKDATPKATGLRAKLTLGKSGKSSSITPSNMPAQLPDARNSPSPLARRKEHKAASTPSASAASSSAYGNLSNVMEGEDEDDDDDDEDDDDDDEDVALLLAPVAQFEAPTPAMPRIQHPRRRITPQTPTRRNGNIPTADKKHSLKAPSQHGAGSLMSFERMISSGNAKLPNDEFGRKIADTAAPFASGAATPSMRSDISFSPPDSPALDSPGGGYGSISQVLLPDVTPSPAVNRSLLSARFSVSPEVSDAGSAAFMKLQLAAARDAERATMEQNLALEEELQQMKQASMQAAEEYAAQIAYLERLLQEQQAQAQAKKEEETAQATAQLESQMQQLQLEHEHAVEDALTQFAEDNEREFAQQMEVLKLKREVSSSKALAAARWDSVRDACQVELEDLQNDREMLAFFRNQLDHLATTL